MLRMNWSLKHGRILNVLCLDAMARSVSGARSLNALRKILQKDKKMQKITPFLWFDNNAEEAMNFYMSVFSDSKLVKITSFGEAGPGPAGSILVAEFELKGQRFLALNGGPQFKFTEAVSFVVNCESQEEVDYFWTKLTADGGEESMCGWLKDKFGLSWQIVPTVLTELLNNKDAAKAQKAMGAMLQMKKIDIQALMDAAGE